MDRRKFLKTSLLTLGAVAVSSTGFGATLGDDRKNNNKNNTTMDYVTLNNGVQML